MNLLEFIIGTGSLSIFTDACSIAQFSWIFDAPITIEFGAKDPSSRGKLSCGSQWLRSTLRASSNRSSKRAP